MCWSQVYDLAQQSEKFLRTELTDNALMTLKRNCGNLFSTVHNRTIDKEELFTAMATTKQFEACLKPLQFYLGPILNIEPPKPSSQAETAGSSSVDLSPLPTASLASCLAGNGMHVAQAGAIILICALFIEAVL